MFWIKHPRTGQPDTMLTLAVAGFVFVIGLVTATTMYLIMHDRELTTLNSVAVLVGAILTPTVAAYTARKYTDGQLNNNNGDKNE